MKKGDLKIGVVHIYNFPYDLAATTRITAYCKGIKKLGNEVEIISIIPQCSRLNEPLKGLCDGGKYLHFAKMPNIKIWGIRTIVYRILVHYCTKKAKEYLVSSHLNKKFDALILSFDEPYIFEKFVPLFQDLPGAKIIAIADEYPIPIRHKLKSSIPASKLKWYKKIYEKIDARILMTDKLRVFYDTKIAPKPTLLLSTIVDTDRFVGVNPSILDREYLCYMGNMELTKDNVDNIILAFKLIKDKYSNLDLHLYGSPSEQSKSVLNKIIQQEGLTDRVFIKGKVGYNEVPSILKGAKILVASQPNTNRAEGGFPTKLGEYFMSDKPTILTNVGEISNYVHDKENAFMVTPENPVEYAETIDYILQNYSFALEVAKKAKNTILSEFSCISAGNRIIDFIKNL